MKCVLVTGAAGFIGFHVCCKLCLDADLVVGLDNLNDYYDVSLKEARLKLLRRFSNFIFVRGDIADRQCVEDLFAQYSFDYVIHLAAQAGVRYSITNPEAYINSNLVGFFNLLEALKQKPPVHFVFASSSSVYGFNKSTPFSVDDKTDCPVSLYAATKKADELISYSYANIYRIPTTGLRFFTVYGPWGRPDMAYFSFTKNILLGKPITLFNNGDMLRDFTYIDDIVHGICSVIGAPPRRDVNNVPFKVYNIGNNQCVRLLDFVRTLEDTIGTKATIEFAPMQKGDVYQTYADIGPMEEDFGFKPKTRITEGLRLFWEWYRSYYGEE